MLKTAPVLKKNNQNIQQSVRFSRFLPASLALTGGACNHRRELWEAPQEPAVGNGHHAASVPPWTERRLAGAQREGAVQHRPAWQPESRAAAHCQGRKLVTKTYSQSNCCSVEMQFYHQNMFFILIPDWAYKSYQFCIYWFERIESLLCSLADQHRKVLLCHRTVRHRGGYYSFPTRRAPQICCSDFTLRNSLLSPVPHLLAVAKVHLSHRFTSFSSARTF